jgi:hypothetical protein
MKLLREGRLPMLFAVFVVLVAISTVVSTLAMIQVQHLASPSDREVVGRLNRGVDVMSPAQARHIISVMTRKAARR